MIQFIMDHLLTIIIIFVALFIIIPFIKSLLSKLLLGAIVIVALVFFGVISSETTESGAKFVEDTIQPIVMNELQSANFHYDDERKEYTLESSSFHLKGTVGENTGEIRFREKTYPIDVRFMEQFIENKVKEAQK